MAKSNSDLIDSIANGDYDEFLGLNRTPATAIPREKSEGSGVLRRVVGDTMVSGIKSAISLPEAVVGLADIPTGGAVGRGLEKIGFRPREAKETLDTLYSPEQQAINRGLAETKGFLPTVAYAAQHPSTIYHAAVESAAPIIGGGAVARGIKAISSAPAWAAGSIGEGVVGAGMAAEGIRQHSQDGYTSPAQSLAAIGSGAGTAMIGALGGKFSNKYGFGDIETMLASGAANIPKSQKGAIRRVAEGAVSEGAEEHLQSAQEQMWQNAALGRDLSEGVMESAALGMLTGGLMGGAINLLAPRGADRSAGQGAGVAQDVAPSGAMVPEAVPPAAAIPQEKATLTQQGQLALGGRKPRTNQFFDKPYYKALVENGVDKSLAASVASLPYESRASFLEAMAQTSATPPLSLVPDNALYLEMRKRGLPHEDAIAVATGDVRNVPGQGDLFDQQSGHSAEAAPAIPYELPAPDLTLESEAEANRRVSPFGQGDLFTGEYRQAPVAQEQADEGSKPRVPKGQTKLFTATGRVSPDVKKGVWSSMQKHVDDLLKNGQITEDQHVMLTNDIAQRTIRPEKMRRNIAAAVAEAATLPRTKQGDLFTGEFKESPVASQPGEEVKPATVPRGQRKFRFRPAKESDKGAPTAVTEKLQKKHPAAAKAAKPAEKPVAPKAEPQKRTPPKKEAAPTVAEKQQEKRPVAKDATEKPESTVAEKQQKKRAKDMSLDEIRAEISSLQKSGADQGRLAELQIMEELKILATAMDKEAKAERKAKADAKRAMMAEDYILDNVEFIPDTDAMSNVISLEEAGLEEGEYLGDTYEVEDADGNVHELRFSTGKGKKSGGVSAEAVRLMVKNITSKWKNPPTVRVLSEDNIPPEFAAWLGARGETNARGFITEAGTIYILAHNNASLADAKATLFHEALGHYGLRAKYREGLAELMQRIYDTNAAVRALANKYMKSHDVSPVVATEEVLAEAQIDGKIPMSVWQRVVAFVRNFVRKLGIEMRFTNEDVMAILNSARKAVVNGPQVQSTGAAMARDAERSTVTYYSKQAMQRAERFLKKQGKYRTVSVVKTPEGTYEVTRVKVDSPKATRTGAADIGANLGTIIKDQSTWAGEEALNLLSFTADVIKRGVAAGLTTAKEFGHMMSEKMAIRDTIEQEIARIMTSAMKLKDRDAAEAFLMDSTLEGKWGYADPKGYRYESDPATPGEPRLVEFTRKVDVDPEMAKKFNSLSDEAKTVVRQVFEFGDKTHAQLQYEVNREINEKYDEMLRVATTKEGRENIEKARREQLTAAGQHIPSLGGPYAPLRRFGKHVVVARSAEMVKAILDGDEKKIREMERDPKHFVVEHFDWKWGAKARERELAASGEFKDGDVRQWVREETGSAAIQMPWEAISKVKVAVEAAGLTGEEQKRLNQLLTSMYLAQLSESSARKAEMHRKGVAGAYKGMFRSFASRGAATAHYIAALKYSNKIDRSIVDMKKDAATGGNIDTKKAIVNELVKRYDQSLSYEDTPIVNGVMKFTSFWMLITSPAYYVQNALQPFMLTLPVLSGRFGVNKAWGAAVQAYKDLFGAIVRTDAHQLDITKLKLAKDEISMLETLRKYGKLDLTITQDMGRYIEGENFMDKAPGAGPLVRKLWAGPQYVELLNRTTSALAAYRLAKSAGKSYQEATDYAEEVVSNTHGDYASFNAPRFFTKNGAMRLITQFRKFQLIQITLLSKLFHGAFWNVDTSGMGEEQKEQVAYEKVIARRQFALLMGVHLAMTGAIGAPLVAFLIGSLMGLDDDEEPFDEDQRVRHFLQKLGVEDKGVLDLLTTGAPSALGIDLSKKIGMGNAFDPLPFVDGLPKDRSSYEKMVTYALGAAVGQGAMLVDAFSKMRAGDYWKGVEAAMPAGLKNAMKGYRIATDGVTSNAGDVLMTPDEVSFIDGFMQGVGLPTMTITDSQRRRGVVVEVEKYFSEQKKIIRHQYTNAVRDEDAEGRKAAIDEWRSLQQLERRLGLKPAPLADLMKAPAEQRRREVKKRGGVEYTAANRGLVESVL